MSVSIICCIFNEISLAPKNFENLFSFCQKQKWNFEIIIIDNNSSDGTKEWLQNLSNDKVVKLFNDINIGKGGSIKLGIANAKYNKGIIFDLDGEYFVDDINDGLFELMNNTIVLASRRLGKEKAKYIYHENYLGVRLIDTLINILYRSNLLDTATGLKFIDINFFKKSKIKYNGFNVDFELVCLALNSNKSIAMIPGKYIPRSKAEGKKIRALKDGFLSLVCIIHTKLIGKFN